MLAKIWSNRYNSFQRWKKITLIGKEEVINNILFQKYRVIRLIGTGGSATVYLAEHIKLESYRAIKRIKKCNPHYNLFMNEAKILKSLKHPNIPVIYDIEEDEEYSYIIEEFIDGQSLKAYRLSQGIILKDNLVNFALQLCNLFQYLHETEQPILYLDLKPDNLIVSQKTLKLIDFGTAIYGKGVKERKISFGTNGYAAPEQYGIHQVDERSDIYGIGMLMFFLITGETLSIDSENIKKLEDKKYCDSSLKNIVYKCLKYYPSQRYQTMKQLKKKLLTLEKNTAKFSRLLPDTSLQVAITGAQSRVGTTHIAIMITSYLNYYLKKTVYIENNNHLVVQTILNHYSSIKCCDAVYQIFQCPMQKEPYPEKNMDQYKIQVIDYGQFSDLNKEEFLKADIRLMVLGTKDWELSFAQKALRELDEYSDIQYLFNFIDGKTYFNMLKSMRGKSCIRVPFHANPFLVKENEPVREFVETCMKEMLREKKSNFIKRHLWKKYK